MTDPDHGPQSAARDLAMYSFLRVFANDGIVDADELAFMERVALRDGRVDADERAVLQRIFDRVDASEVDTETRAKIRAFKKRHGLS